MITLQLLALEFALSIYIQEIGKNKPKIAKNDFLSDRVIIISIGIYEPPVSAI